MMEESSEDGVDNCDGGLYDSGVNGVGGNDIIIVQSSFLNLPAKEEHAVTCTPPPDLIPNGVVDLSIGCHCESKASHI
jgi:hypothetical protein